MVKRPPSPKLHKTSNLLVIWQPFPLNANYEQPDHCKQLFVWVASVLRSYEHVLAIHHKPSARSTVLVEIDKKKKPDALLAEHRWHEVLKNPTPDDEKRVSRVYYSVYGHAREAQKDGWKSVHLDSSWFDDQTTEEFMDWAEEEGPFVMPYPAAYWCADLEEDSTNKRIARPLPRAAVAPPAAPAPLVPGSAAYALAQQAKELKQPQPKKGAASSNSWEVPKAAAAWGPPLQTPSQSASASAPTFSTAAKPTGGKSAWSRGPPTSALSAKAGGATSPTAWGSSNGPAPATGTRAPAATAWSKPSKSIKNARSTGGPSAPPAFPPGVPAPVQVKQAGGKGKGKGAGAGAGADAVTQAVDNLAISSPTATTRTQSLSWADQMDDADDDLDPITYQVVDNPYDSDSDNGEVVFKPFDADEGSDPEADFMAQFEHEVLGGSQGETAASLTPSTSVSGNTPASPIPEGFTGVGKRGRGKKKNGKGAKSPTPEADGSDSPVAAHPSLRAVGITHSFKHEYLGFDPEYTKPIPVCPYHQTTCKKGICDWRKKTERDMERAETDKKKKEDKERRRQEKLEEERKRLEKEKERAKNGGSQSGSENSNSDGDDSDVSVDSGDGGAGGNGRGARGGWGRARGNGNGRGRGRGRGWGRGAAAQGIRS
ncbi:hypothetical protein BKA70DRAFT_647472 [Coprinopsis sp. MPI-PUGE-AT-0042]|nr:hypothetical protein BKA70DRAFT_647472 [Coprinopsis sp. MPI-PUGE-AT-0042]